MSSGRSLALRWTIGDATPRGFEALRLSLWGAHRLFGSKAEYVVCVNTVSLPEARRRTGPTPPDLTWIAATPRHFPEFLRERLAQDDGAPPVWSFAPLRLFPDRFELAIDNECILWDWPSGLARWLADGRRCLVAADLDPPFGVVAAPEGIEPRSAGLRGLPPTFDLEAALREVLAELPDGPLAPETVEHELQTAAVARPAPPYFVPQHDVSVCAPFVPELCALGRCGTRFVGLNARHLPWTRGGRPATAWIADHFDQYRRALYEHVGLPPP
jgi:hypothetical protein